MPTEKNIKIGGKAVKRTKSTTRQPKASNKLSPADQVVYDKLQELQEFCVKQNIPHFVVCQMPDSKQPVATASFSGTDDAKQAMINAEWLFGHMGGFLQQITNGFLRVIKFY